MPRHLNSSKQSSHHTYIDNRRPLLVFTLFFVHVSKYQLRQRILLFIPSWDACAFHPYYMVKTYLVQSQLGHLHKTLVLLCITMIFFWWIFTIFWCEFVFSDLYKWLFMKRMTQVNQIPIMFSSNLHISMMFTVFIYFKFHIAKFDYIFF